MEPGSKKIYTRTGDKGKTSLVGGARVSKSALRLDVYGTVDELNSWIGVIERDASDALDHVASDALGHVASDALDHRSTCAAERDDLTAFLRLIQSDLFNVGSRLACEDLEIRASLPNVGAAEIKSLEDQMDLYSTDLKPLKNFILPGGSRPSGSAHIARTVCRRAERLCVALSETSPEDPIEDEVIQFINRLSDYLFVLARHLNRLLGFEEPIWAPRAKG